MRKADCTNSKNLIQDEGPMQEELLDIENGEPKYYSNGDVIFFQAQRIMLQ